MNVVDLTIMVLSSSEKNELQTSIDMLEQSNFSAF